jgi:hypothetical protein
VAGVKTYPYSSSVYFIGHSSTLSISLLKQANFKSVASPIFRYETCVEKLQLISSCKPSVDGEAHTRHTEREDFRKEVQQVIQRIEKAKENSCVILHNKRQVYVCNIKGVIFGAIVWDFYTVLHTFVIGLCLPSHIFLNPI